MESGLSTGDLALMNNRGDSFADSSFMWIFALLILAGGGNLFGGSRVGEQYATQADVQRAVDLNSIQSGQADISADIQRTNYEQIGATKDAAYNNLSEIRDIQSTISTGFANQATCCCETKQAIMENRYLDAQNAANINANTVAQTQKILDAIATNRMADMQNQINQLQMANAMAGVVRYPSASTYYAGTNPFCSGGNCLANI